MNTLNEKLYLVIEQLKEIAETDEGYIMDFKNKVELQERNSFLERIRFLENARKSDIDAIKRMEKRVQELELENNTLRSANSVLRANRAVLRDEIETLKKSIKTPLPEFDQASKKKNVIIQDQAQSIIQLRNQIRHYQELMGHIQRVADKFGVREEGVSPIDSNDPLFTRCG